MKACKSSICFQICSGVLAHYALFWLENTWSSVLFMEQSVISFTSCCVFFPWKYKFNLLQKPGGIIALLDEAWYNKIFFTCSYTLVFSYTVTIFSKHHYYVLYTFILSTACYQSQILKHFLRSCITHSRIISASWNQNWLDQILH